MSDQPINGHDAALPDTVIVEDLDQFARLVSHWHQHKIALLHHLKAIPDGTEVMVGEDTALTLSGDLRRGFILAVEMVLMEFGTLPFAAEVGPHEQH